MTLACWHSKMVDMLSESAPVAGSYVPSNAITVGIRPREVISDCSRISPAISPVSRSSPAPALSTVLVKTVTVTPLEVVTGGMTSDDRFVTVTSRRLGDGTLLELKGE